VFEATLKPVVSSHTIEDGKFSTRRDERVAKSSSMGMLNGVSAFDPIRLAAITALLAFVAIVADLLSGLVPHPSTRFRHYAPSSWKNAFSISNGTETEEAVPGDA
jgi:hypothetical protein